MLIHPAADSHVLPLPPHLLELIEHLGRFTLLGGIPISSLFLQVPLGATVGPGCSGKGAGRAQLSLGICSCLSPGQTHHLKVQNCSFPFCFAPEERKVVKVRQASLASTMMSCEHIHSLQEQPSHGKGKDPTLNHLRSSSFESLTHRDPPRHGFPWHSLAAVPSAGCDMSRAHWGCNIQHQILVSTHMPRAEPTEANISLAGDFEAAR